MKQRFVFFLLFPLILLACATLVPARPDDDRPLSTVFDDLVCEPPCWQSIIPGESTREETLESLRELAVFDDQIYEWKNGIGISFYNRSVDPVKPVDEVVEEVEFVFNNEVLQAIIFEGDSLVSTRKPLWYVLHQLGEPEYAIQEMYGEIGWMTILYYPERGIEIWCMPRSFLVIGSIGCNLESDVRIYFYPPEDYETQLVGKYGSPENAQYAQSFFCPWVGVEAQYLSVDWGPINNPDEYPTLSPAEVKSQCPTGK